MVVYLVDYTPIASKLKKLKKRDRVQFEAVKKKMNQIVLNPHMYKPLKNILKGRYRAHIGHFVLLFVIHTNEKVVEFIEYEHHDKAYKNK